MRFEHSMTCSFYQVCSGCVIRISRRRLSRTLTQGQPAGRVEEGGGSEILVGSTVIGKEWSEQVKGGQGGPGGRL